MNKEKADEVQTSPPSWFHILEELLNMANTHVNGKNAKVYPQANTMQPMVSSGKNRDSGSGDADSEVPS